MNYTISFNATKMFAARKPWDCSNSQANLGDQAARLTWQSAQGCVGAVPPKPAWLLSPLSETLDAIRENARGYGAWTEDEILAWTPQECLALFVQEVASDLRLLGSDDHDLAECVKVQNTTNWDNQSEYPICSFYKARKQVFGSRYMGI